MTLGENFNAISTLKSVTTIDFEFEEITVSGYPARKHHYIMTVGDSDFQIVSFLFPNGKELQYIQLGVPVAETFNQALLDEVYEMIMNLHIPPNAFHL
jgi:hypothetical protein